MANTKNITEFSPQEILNRVFDSATNLLGIGLSTSTGTSVVDDTTGAVKTTKVTADSGEDSAQNTQSVTMKPVPSGDYAPQVYSMPSTQVTKANIAASPGNVYSLRVTNENASARYFQLHNKASAPSAGETAQRYWKIPAGTAASPGILMLDSSYLAPSEPFSTGIGFAISTTRTTFTDSATNTEHELEVRYIT